MIKKYKSADDFSYKNDSDEFEKMMDVHNIDEYDISLQDIKRLANERKEVPPQYRKAYDLAIDHISEQIIEGFHDDIPYKMMMNDIESAKRGGKFRKIYPVTDRKKKISKANPKRKLSKKIIKKVIRKPKKK